MFTKHIPRANNCFYVDNSCSLKSLKMDEVYDVVVIGSCMIDLMCYAPRLPKNGETLLGTKLVIGFGGKGCNQCVAARKLKGKCLLVARVGSDTFGKSYLDKIVELGMSIKFVKTTEGTSTGTAQITVADSGENQIVIVPGANDTLTEDDVIEARKDIVNCKVLLCQMEIPEACTIKALEIKSRSKTGTSIFNAAPAKEDMNPLLYTLPDIFCVNEVEAEILTGVKVKEVQDADVALEKLKSKGCKKVIITLGDRGCVYGQKGSDEHHHIPAYSVKTIDTTGAGDAFVGSLAYYMATRPDLTVRELLEKASRVASISVTRMGTQDSYPEREELV